jgi:hypothetical protein
LAALTLVAGVVTSTAPSVLALPSGQLAAWGLGVSGQRGDGTTTPTMVNAVTKPGAVQAFTARNPKSRVVDGEGAELDDPEVEKGQVIFICRSRN